MVNVQMNEKYRTLELINMLNEDMGISIAGIASITKYTPTTIYRIIKTQSCNRLQEKNMFPRIVKRWDNKYSKYLIICE